MPPPPFPAGRLRRGSRGALRRLHPHREPLVVRLKGDLDASSVRRMDRILRAALSEAPKALEIDLSRVTHLSPDGMVPLFLAARVARAQGIELTVTHAPDQAGALMRRMGLRRYLSGDGSNG